MASGNYLSLASGFVRYLFNSSFWGLPPYFHQLLKLFYRITQHLERKYFLVHSSVSTDIYHFPDHFLIISVAAFCLYQIVSVADFDTDLPGIQNLLVLSFLHHFFLAIEGNYLRFYKFICLVTNIFDLRYSLFQCPLYLQLYL